MNYSDEERNILLGVALASIRNGLETGRALPVQPVDYPPRLSEQRASFVTLNRGEALRGCIGSLEPVTSLVESVADNAFAAAFRDPRFPALTTPELDLLSIHISVLSPVEPVEVTSEQELLTLMVPGEAGWIIQENGYRGTFLPSVWSSLPQPAEFLRHLKMKAGLAADYWSDTLVIRRYTTESFSAAVTDIRH